MLSKQIVVVPYRLGSKSAKSLTQNFTDRGKRKVFQVSETSKAFKPKINHVIVNWGLGRSPNWRHDGKIDVLYNAYEAVARTSNKLSSFKAFANNKVLTPEFTDNQKIAQDWWNNGDIVVCRTVLNGHSGAGIVLSSSVSRVALVAAPLYVRYVKKTKEFRVHVAFGRVIDTQEKRKRQEVPTAEVNFQVRSHANGWVFCRENINKPKGLDEIACGAIAALGLDFGAVDIIFNERSAALFVLEVNTAPGLEGATVQSYSDAIWNKVYNK